MSITLHPSVMKDRGRFSAKLNFDQRCQILALDRAGVSRRVLAAAYQVNRSTINFICTPSSPHYKNVRAKLIELGPDEFDRQYLTDDVMVLVNEHKRDDEVALSDTQFRAKRKAINENKGPNPNANSHAGEHRMTSASFDGQTYFAEVVWIEEDGETRGWALVVRGRWAKLATGEEQDFYVHPSDLERHTGNDPELFNTSKQALDAWLQMDGGELV